MRDSRRCFAPYTGGKVGAIVVRLTTDRPSSENAHMLDHISIPVVDVHRAAEFYDAVLATIGLHRRKERPGAIGYGMETRAAPIFWILKRESEGGASPGLGLHVSFQAPDRSSVDAFHKTALRCGGGDAGKPGLRPQ
jgi:catechol 2,3-dioxygenase-like lactoylglutathione lyase family enzyme